MVMTDDPKAKNARTLAAIGKRLQEILQVDIGKLPSAVAERLKLLDLKVRRRLNGDGH
jgi:hypothetical protein